MPNRWSFLSGIFPLVLVILFLGQEALLLAEMRATTPDGRPVILFPDGTWRFDGEPGGGDPSDPSVVIADGLAKELREARWQVLEVGGEALVRRPGGWEPVRTGEALEGDQEFRTGGDGFLKVRVFRGNVVTLLASSTFALRRPHTVDGLSATQMGRLESGDVSVDVAPEGRETLFIEAKRVSTRGMAGRFKVIARPDADAGEVVIKNGLVEVSEKSGPGGKPRRVTGFYRVEFRDGRTEEPTQAEIIRYDWR